MSTTLDEAPAPPTAVNKAADSLGRLMEAEVSAPITFVRKIMALVEAMIEADRIVRAEEIARSRAPVGEEERIRALLGDPRDSVSVGPEGPVYHHHEAPAPPAKDTGEDANWPTWLYDHCGRTLTPERAQEIADRTADLEQRLADQTDDLLRIHNEKVDHFTARITAERERDEARSSLETAERQRDDHFREIKRAQTIIDEMKAWRAAIYDASVNADGIATLLAEYPDASSRSFVAVQIAEECDRCVARATIAATERAEAAESSLETAERRIGEAVERLKWDTEHSPECRHDPGQLIAILTGKGPALAALTPDAGTARSAEAEEGE